MFEAGDRGFNEWYYKATGRPRDFQLNAYPADHVDTGDDKAGCIVANVWNFDSRWSVHIYENGVKKTMQQYSGHDPMMRDLLLDDGDTRPNYPGSDGGTTVSQNPGSAASNHLFYYKPDDPDAEFVVEVTDRFGHVYRSEPVLRNMMVASFTEEDGEWVYRNDFNTLPRFANQFDTGSGLAKGTFVQGHTPAGWYASTSGTMQPNVARWGQFNYLRINNGDQSAAGLYSYGSGNTQAQEEQDADRALGSLVSTVSHRDICYGVAIENNTGQVITTLQVSYTGEMWRAGSDPAAGQQLTFAYGKREDNHSLRDREEWIGELDGLTPVDSLSFRSPAGNTAAEAATPNTAINGNDPRNRTRVDGSIELNLEPGAVAILRWEDADDSGSDHALAIDDLCLRATLAPASGLPPAHVHRHDALHPWPDHRLQPHPPHSRASVRRGRPMPVQPPATHTGARPLGHCHPRTIYYMYGRTKRKSDFLIRFNFALPPKKKHPSPPRAVGGHTGFAGGHARRVFEAATFACTDGGTLNYRKLEPAAPEAGKQYPLVLFLHGKGECGTDNLTQLRYGADLFTRQSVRDQYPAFVLFPQCPPEHFGAFDEEPPSYDATTFSGRLPHLHHAAAGQGGARHLPATRRRGPRPGVCLWPVDGRHGHFDLVCRFPDVFAAAVPLCGGVNVERPPTKGSRRWHGASSTATPTTPCRWKTRGLPPRPCNSWEPTWNTSR